MNIMILGEGMAVAQLAMAIANCEGTTDCTNMICESQYDTQVIHNCKIEGYNEEYYQKYFEEENLSWISEAIEGLSRLHSALILPLGSKIKRWLIIKQPKPKSRLIAKLYK